MMKPERAKYLPIMEFGGILFCMLYALLARQWYEWNDRELIGVLFGAVNNSVWEQTKILLMPFLLWGMLEQLSLQPSLHRLTAAKTAALYSLAAVMLLGGCFLRDTEAKSFRLLCVLALCTGVAVGLMLYYCRWDLHGFFAPCVFLLFLFLACYFSLTPFPLHSALFCDATTGAYGLQPMIPS